MLYKRNDTRKPGLYAINYKVAKLVPPTYRFLSLLFVLETLIFLMCLDHLCQVGYELVRLREEVGKTLILLFVNELTVTFFILQHEAAQTFFLYTLLFLLLFPLGIHVVHHQSLVQLANLLVVLAVEFPARMGIL